MRIDGTPVEVSDIAAGVFELDNPETWPSDLLEFIHGVDRRPEAIRPEPVEVVRVLTGRDVRTYHLTRLTSWEVDSVYRVGLRRASPELAEERLEAALARGAIDLGQVKRRRERSLANAPNRIGYRDLCGTRHPLLERMRWQVYHFWEYWGGEVLYAGVPAEERRGMQHPGVPAIVVAVFPVLDWAKHVWASLTDAMWQAVHEPEEARGCTVHLEDRDLPPFTIEAVVQPTDPLWGLWVE